jgi:hypothetical protein
MENLNFVDSELAFEKCFNTDHEREQYMYIYSKDNKHYFKHIDTREYKIVEVKELTNNSI